MKYEEIRPRAKTVLAFVDLDLGMDVLVNYNMETPEEQGWWYEAKITGWKCTSSNKSLICSILAKDSVPDCKIVFIDEVMALEKPQTLAASPL